MGFYCQLLRDPIWQAEIDCTVLVIQFSYILKPTIAILIVNHAASGDETSIAPIRCSADNRKHLASVT